MEEQTKQRKGKRAFLPIVAFLLMVGMVWGATTLVHQHNVEVNLANNLECANLDAVLNAFPSEDEIHTITCTNAGAENQNALLTSTETENLNNVDYTVDAPQNIVALPGVNNYDVTYHFNGGTPVGTLKTTIGLTRTD